MLVDDDGTFVFPALPVDVVDTTGCGDAFSAGYLYALSLGWPPRRACRLGHLLRRMVAGTLGSDGVRASPHAALALLDGAGRPDGLDPTVGAQATSSRSSIRSCTAGHQPSGSSSAWIDRPVDEHEDLGRRPRRRSRPPLSAPCCAGVPHELAQPAPEVRLLLRGAPRAAAARCAPARGS